MKKLIIISSIVALVGGGIYFYARQLSLLQNFTYDFLGIHIESLTQDRVEATLTMRIHSSATLQAKITDLDLDFLIGDKKLGKIQGFSPIIIPARGFSDISLNISFSPSQIGQNAYDLLNLMVQQKDIPLSFQGSASVESAFLKVELPISYNTTLRNYFSSN
jgi:LEA14-like dessication related protein